MCHVGFVICLFDRIVYVFVVFFFFLMIRRPPRSTLDRSSAASDVYKRQQVFWNITIPNIKWALLYGLILTNARAMGEFGAVSVSYTHLRAHETVLDLVCRLLLEKKKHYTYT